MRILRALCFIERVFLWLIDEILDTEAYHASYVKGLERLNVVEHLEQGERPVGEHIIFNYVSLTSGQVVNANDGVLRILE